MYDRMLHTQMLVEKLSSYFSVVYYLPACEPEYNRIMPLEAAWKTDVDADAIEVFGSKQITESSTMLSASALYLHGLAEQGLNV